MGVLERLEKGEVNWSTWTKEERKQILTLYYLVSKNEPAILDLVYSYHGCDSWEDIFRDYSKTYLRDKLDGVKIALNAFDEYESYRTSNQK